MGLEEQEQPAKTPKASKGAKPTAKAEAEAKAAASPGAPHGSGAGEAKHVADTRTAAGLAGRARKARICFNWQRKGRCPKGDTCPKLHAGEPSENRAAHVEKALERKTLVAAAPTAPKRKAEDGAATATTTHLASSAKRKSKPPDWICPKCANQNWGRRAVCNGRTCGGMRPGSEAGAAAKSPDGSNMG
ncbi:hypothetical protein KFE25_007583 [Diacronema lutheri]|uniref:C3H1-type domain-containing protein n=1 Tax=Diacronema lutheri TaxID=2081491 RepID=A0A8J5XW66_DIALT|nr:hypothetical protein KFE25_007583 [Diacronema lutheri]